VKDRVSLFIFCQSLGWDVMQSLPFMDGLADNRASARPILGSACASLPTVLSGTLPDRHKHFAWFYYSPLSTPFRLFKYFSYLPVLKNSRRLRENLVLAVKRSFGITGRLSIFNMPLKHLPLFDFAEKDNLFKPGGLGKVPTLFDLFLENNVNYFCSSPDRTDVGNADAMGAALQKGEVSAAFWHLSGMEHILTRLGPESVALRARVAWLDLRIRGIYEIASRRYHRVDLAVFSDTGVVPILDVYDLQRRIDDTGSTPYEDYVAIYEPTMARFWFISNRSRPVVRHVLDSLPCGRILSQEDLAAEGCWFDDYRFGEVIFLARPGTVFTPNNIIWELPASAGGYHPDTPGMAAGFVCNIPRLQPPKTVAGIHNLIVENVAELAGVRRNSKPPPGAAGAGEGVYG